MAGTLLSDSVGDMAVIYAGVQPSLSSVLLSEWRRRFVCDEREFIAARGRSQRARAPAEHGSALRSLPLPQARGGLKGAFALQLSNFRAPLESTIRSSKPNAFERWAFRQEHPSQPSPTPSAQGGAELPFRHVSKPQQASGYAGSGSNAQPAKTTLGLTFGLR